MIRRKKPISEWTDGLDCPLYEGEERRIIPDRRTYYEQTVINPPEKKPPFTPSFGLQLLITAGTVITSSFGIYISMHDEQLNMKSNFKYFEERYTADQERHNNTHQKIYSEIESLSKQSESLEQTVTQFMAINRGRK